MPVRTRWWRLGVGAIAAGALAGGWAGPPSGVHASTSLTINHGACHNLNPVATQNALTAVRSDDRPWAQISSFTMAGGASKATITFNLCGSVPSFPVASGSAAGDTGVQWIVCFKDDNSPMMQDNNGTQTGVDPVTGAVYDGPYPSDDGWRVCAWAAVNAGVPGVTSGVATWDQVGHYNFFDQSLLGFPFTPATVSSGTVTMTFPYTWTISRGDGLGHNVTANEPWVTPGDTLGAVTASAHIATDVGLPSPVCLPPNSIGPVSACGIVGPIQGLASRLVMADWAPGFEYCDPLFNVAGNNIANPVSCHKTGDLGDGFANGFDLGLAAPYWLLGGIVSPVDHFDPVGTVDVANRPPCVPPAIGSNTCSVTGYRFVYGREFTGVLPVPIDGLLYSGTAQYLDGGDSLVA